ncbi:MAG TPA: outer membrane beta-barrel protein [Gammaproteobacteria bacterium]|nr:outer membrane beta-barrel protein [Gammaproteobacteria bacterium]
MKKIAKTLIAAGVMLAAGTVTAEMMDDVKPYVGLDYYHAWMKGAKGKVNGITGWDFDFTKSAPKSYPGATIYAGAKLTEFFGLELGADWSMRKKKMTTDDDGDKIKFQTKRTAMHADIVLSAPLNECYELLGFVGAGWVKPKTTVSETDAVTGEITSITPKIKAKTIARLGLGVNYMINETIGFRTKVGWENTHRLKATIPNTNLSLKLFKDTVSLSLGAFVRW